MAGAVVLALLAAALAWIVSRPHEATALISIEPGYPVPEPDMRPVFAPLLDALVGSYIETLRADRILLAAIDTVSTGGAAHGSPEAARETAGHWRNRLVVERLDPSSRLVRVTLAARTPEVALGQLNALIDTFVDDALARDREQATRDLRTLSAALPELDARRSATSQALHGADTSHNGDGAVGEHAQVRRRLVDLARATLQLDLLIGRVLADRPDGGDSHAAAEHARRELAQWRSDLSRPLDLAAGSVPDRVAFWTADAGYQVHAEQIAALALYASRGAAPVRVLDAARVVARPGARWLLVAVAVAGLCGVLLTAWTRYRESRRLLPEWLDTLETLTGVPVLALLPADSQPGSEAVQSLAVALSIELAARDTTTFLLVRAGHRGVVPDPGPAIVQALAADGVAASVVSPEEAVALETAADAGVVIVDVAVNGAAAAIVPLSGLVVAVVDAGISRAGASRRVVRQLAGIQRAGFSPDYAVLQVGPRWLA